MSKIWQKKRTLSRNYYNTKITDEYGRNLAKNTLHKLSPLVIKRSNYIHSSSYDVFDGRNVLMHSKRGKCMLMSDRTELTKNTLYCELLSPMNQYSYRYRHFQFSYERNCFRSIEINGMKLL